MPYVIYTYENVNLGVCSIQDAIGVLNTEDDQQPRLDTIEQCDCVLGKGMNDQMFDLIKYSNSYCKMSCKVLMDGYEVLGKWMLEHTGLYIDHYTAIQPLASDCVLKRGCYNNVFQISGVLQHYLTRAVVGGSCVTANNKLYHVKQENE